MRDNSENMSDTTRAMHQSLIKVMCIAKLPQCEDIFAGIDLPLPSSVTVPIGNSPLFRTNDGCTERGYRTGRVLGNLKL